MSFYRENLKKILFGNGIAGLFLNPFYIARSELQRSVRLSAPRISGKTLDVGCGSKPYERLFSSVTEYIGIDIANPSHDHSDQKVDLFYDGKNIPFGPDTFDSLVCFQVLEHVFEPEHLIGEFCRVLKPGGTLLLTVPLLWEEHEVPYDFGRYTSFGLRYIFEKSGFEVVEQGKACADFRIVQQLSLGFLFGFVSKFLPRPLNYLILSPITVITNLFSFLFRFMKSDTMYLDNVLLCKKKES